MELAQRINSWNKVFVGMKTDNGIVKTNSQTEVQIL
jgi:hypothetical protein